MDISDTPFGLFLLLASITALYVYLTWHHTYWRDRGIAYDVPVPAFGSMMDYLLGRRSSGEIFNDIYRKFTSERVVGVYSVGHKSPCLVLRDPAIIHRVLVSDFHHFATNENSFLDDQLDMCITKSLFYQEGEPWKRSRALLSPAFTAVKVRNMYPQMEKIAKDFVDYLKKKHGEIQLKDVTTRYTSEIVAVLAYGIEGHSFEEAEPLVAALGEKIFAVDQRVLLKHIVMYSSPWLRRLLRFRLVPQSVTSTMESILRDVMAYRQKHAAPRHDFLQHLIDIRTKADGADFTDLDVMSSCLTFFVEGYETTSAVLSHVLYNLAKNREAQDRLYAEIDAAAKEFDGSIPCDAVAEMPYMNLVFLESSRIFPVQYGMYKVCTERYEMDIGKQKPLIVEKGIPVFIPTYSIHRDPALWVEPLAFNPERFTNNEATTLKSKGVFLPFSDGPRMCIGSRLATILVKIALIHILREFEVVPSPKTPEHVQLDPKHFMVSHKGGLYLNIVKRKRIE